MRLVGKNGQEIVWFCVWVVFMPDDRSCKYNLINDSQINYYSWRSDSVPMIHRLRRKRSPKSGNQPEKDFPLKINLKAKHHRISQMIRMLGNRPAPFLAHIPKLYWKMNMHIVLSIDHWLLRCDKSKLPNKNFKLFVDKRISMNLCWIKQRSVPNDK